MPMPVRRCAKCGSIIGKIQYLGPKCTDICPVCAGRMAGGTGKGRDIPGQLYLGDVVVSEGKKRTRSAATERACI